MPPPRLSCSSEWWVEIEFTRMLLSSSACFSFGKMFCFSFNVCWMNPMLSSMAMKSLCVLLSLMLLLIRNYYLERMPFIHSCCVRCGVSFSQIKGWVVCWEVNDVGEREWEYKRPERENTITRIVFLSIIGWAARHRELLSVAYRVVVTEIDRKKGIMTSNRPLFTFISSWIFSLLELPNYFLSYYEWKVWFKICTTVAIDRI